MALFKWNKDNPKDDLEGVPKTEFDKEKDLQDLLQANPEAIEPDLFIVDQEYTNWEDSRRRIDLLGLDRKGNIVVVELKRDEDPFMDLQAIRYAALVSTMTFNDLVKKHSVFLSKRDEGAKPPEELIEESRKSLLKFLSEGSDDEVEIKSDDEVEISSTPRIILVAPEFPKELTTAILWLNDLWLNDQGLDIKCVQAIHYKLGEESLIDISQVIPLKEAADYQVKKAEKEREQAAQRKGTRGENTRIILMREGVIKEGTVITLLLKGEEDINPEERRAQFTGNKGEVVWKGNAYRSLNQLCTHMRDNHGFSFPPRTMNGYAYWALEGDNESLWEKSQPYRREDFDA